MSYLDSSAAKTNVQSRFSGEKYIRLVYLYHLSSYVKGYWPLKNIRSPKRYNSFVEGFHVIRNKSRHVVSLHLCNVSFKFDISIISSTYVHPKQLFVKVISKTYLLVVKSVKGSPRMINLWKVPVIRFKGMFYLWAFVEFKRREMQPNCHLANEAKINYSYSFKRYDKIRLLSYFRPKLSTLR